MLSLISVIFVNKSYFYNNSSNYAKKSNKTVGK